MHENVLQFPASMLQKQLGKYYVIVSEVVTPLTNGRPVERKRRLTWLIHKRTIVARQSVPGYMDWNSVFYDIFRRRCECTYAIYYDLASDDDLLEEKRWAAPRKEVQLVRGDADVSTGTLFFETLTPQELAWVRGYQNLLPGGGVVSLTQNPFKRPSHNNGQYHLMTQIKNSYPMLSLDAKRWLTWKEHLAAHDYPVFGGPRGETTNFLTDRESRGLPARNPLRIFEQAGNGMSLVCIGTALLWLYGFTPRGLLVPEQDLMCRPATINN